MFKGTDTQIEYQECVDKGLCVKHLKDVDKKDRAAVKNEFSRNAFNFVRINILYPLLFKKSPKCEKIKRLMEKTPPIARILSSDLSKVGDVIFVMDSVVIFTMCQLSKVCCVGALFHTIRSNSEDPDIKALENLLLAERFENADIRYLYPALQRYFVNCDLDIIRATHCITLLFIRKFCNKSNIKIAIEAIKTEMNSSDNYIETPELKIKGSLYCSEFYLKLARHYFDLQAFIASALFSHLAVSLDPTSNEGWFLFIQSTFKLDNSIAGMMPNFNPALFKGISPSTLTESASNNHFTHDERLPFMKEKINSVSVDLVDSDSAGSDIEAASEDTSKMQAVTTVIKNEKDTSNVQAETTIIKNEKDTSKVQAETTIIKNENDNSKVQADTTIIKNEKDTSKDQAENINVKNENSDNSEKKGQDSNKRKLSVLSQKITIDENIPIGKLIERGKKSPDFLQRGIDTTDLFERRKHSSIEKRKKSQELLVKGIKYQEEIEKKSQEGKGKKTQELLERGKKSPDLFEKGKKSPDLLERGKRSPTPPILPNKDLPKKKRTISDGSVSSLVEAEMDISKINSLLKEASEALLVDCGYKAVQIFRGPLRSFIDSLDTNEEAQSFEEGDIVCIKYSYGIAYCKSGGCDDLQRSITIFKDVIKNHDSITFPAAYYSVGLCYRKLNRFREALNYLENVKDFLYKGIYFKVYPWPGMNTAIQETKPEILKTLVEDLIKECENPPTPDAFCRFKKCSLQPSIYYSDPDFKGYISLFCSQQCHLQYHYQCWKSIREEKLLTEKDFLEKSCFTPDCEGLIAKIQNIDKKGVLSKEFSTDIKKSTKQKWNKCEKKVEVKEKDKKKKKNIKAEDHSSESLNETVKCNSRKNSAVDDPVQLLSESSSSTEETLSKQPTTKKYQQNVIQETTQSETSLKAVTKSQCKESPQENSGYASTSENSNDVKEELPHENKPDTYFIECIKEKIYSYLEEFLQRHGPLKIDDPVLLHEVSSFPDEACEIISNSGGIGEFLKNDLRFAYVGDCYVCIVSDLGTAYKMFSSLPTDFKTLQTLEGEENIAHQGENYTEDRLSNLTLNPDAVEYTPYIPFHNNKDSFKSLTHPSFSQNCGSNFSLPASFESSSKYDNCDTYGHSKSFPEPVNKSKSSETVLKTESKVFVPNKFLGFRIKLPEEFKPNKEPEKVDELKLSGMISKSDVDLAEKETFDSQVKAECPSMYNTVANFSGKRLPAKFSELEAQLMPLLKQYCSDEMKKYHQNTDSGIKPFVIKEIHSSVSLGTMTDVTELEGDKHHENVHPSEDQNTINNLKAEVAKLFTRNAALQRMLNYVTEQQQKEKKELSEAKKNLNDYNSKIQKMKDDFELKEQALLSEKLELEKFMKNLKDTVEQQDKEIKSLTDDRNLLEIDILSLKMDKDKFKNHLDDQEKKFKSVIETLQKENVELKNQAKYAEIQVINMKKTECLRRIEDKSIEAADKQKELNASIAMMGANFNPVLLNYVKILSSKLISYTNNLNILKLEFLRTMDGYIKEIEKGVSLKDLKIVEMKELPAVPSWKNTFPNNPLTDNSLLNVASSFNFKYVPPISPSPSPPISASGPKLAGPPSEVPLPTPSSNVPLPTPAPKGFLPTPPSNVPLPTPAPKGFLPTPPSNIPLPTPTVDNLKAPITQGAFAVSQPLIQPSSAASKSSNDTDFGSLNPKTQESFKSGLASTNSFASSHVASALDYFDMKNLVLNQSKPISSSKEGKPDFGFKNPEAAAASAMAANGRPISRSEVKASPFSSSEKLSFGNLDTVTAIKPETVPSAAESENKRTNTTVKNSYQQLLSKMKDQFPSYSEEELIALLGEFRSQRSGKLTGLSITSIISGISVIIDAKKKALEQAKQQTKSKTLVNKKLVPDTKATASVSEQPSVKKKTAWNLSSDQQRPFTGNADDDCTICYDPMDEISAYKVNCGHFFHEKCIREWLKNQSNCPVCRVLLLLPEEYPSLK